jgi:hypothetical protein
MHWTTYCHIPGGAPEKPARPRARQADSMPDAAGSRLQADGARAPAGGAKSRCRAPLAFARVDGPGQNGGG